jgi:DNA-binding NarL/FixJ family response regulator
MDTYLEPVWSGALERAGLAVGLSSYRGRSTLASIIEPVAFAHGEVTGSEPSSAKPKKPRAKPGEHVAAIVVLLRKGASYNGISRALGVSVSAVRFAARQAGIDCRARSRNWRVHAENL